MERAGLGPTSQSITLQAPKSPFRGRFMPNQDISEQQAKLSIRSGFHIDNTPYEIFRGDTQKPLVRLGSLTGLERAIDLARRLAARSPSDYFIFHATTHELASTVSTTPQSTSVRMDDVVQGAELSNLRPAIKA